MLCRKVIMLALLLAMVIMSVTARDKKESGKKMKVTSDQQHQFDCCTSHQHNALHSTESCQAELKSVTAFTSSFLLCSELVQRSAFACCCSLCCAA
jgi:hypothetical protein